MNNFVYKSIFDLFLIPQALKIESGFICLIALFLLIALVPLAILTVWGCASHSNGVSDCSSSAGLEPNNVPPVDSLQTLDEVLGNGVHYRRRMLQFALQLIIAMLMCVYCVS